ncbi:MAG: DHH family phosphoesterase [Candidatus Aenigmatarchaeota archaeon]
MIDPVESLINEALRAADRLKLTSENIRVVSHYDCDGISSGAIMVKALKRAGKKFQLSMIKQLGRGELEKICKKEYNFFVFLDIGAGQLDIIQELIPEAPVIISDHHQPQGYIKPENAERILHINPTHFGITENISGSGTTYLIARAMDPENKDLSELGIIGAIGDSQIGSIGPDWGLAGLNREILKDAETTGKLEVSKGLRLWGMNTRPVHKTLEYSSNPNIPGISGSESSSIQFLQEMNIELKNGDGDWRTLSELTKNEHMRLASGIIRERIRGDEDNPEEVFGDVYELKSRTGIFSNANEFATMLNACGKLYKAYLGVALCLHDDKSGKEVKTLLRRYRREIGKALSLVNKTEGMIKTEENANYILAGDQISEHIISNITSILSRSGEIPLKPTFALVDAEDEKVKISARASDEDVKNGINLKEILTEATKEVGGEGGGHKGSAGGTIPRGTVETFINCTNTILKNIQAVEVKNG